MTHAPVFVSPADELRELAAECAAIERHDGALFAAGTVRPVMRDMLAEHARNIGVPAGEIEGAVDAAITAAGATP
tara:strand:+ start:35 stop:259 length:225 start_codon:yes stop_codon:yes gene_type:complete